MFSHVNFRALSAYWSLKSIQTSSGFRTYNLSLKRNDKWSISSTSIVSNWFRLLSSTFPRVRSRKKRTVALYGQKLPSFHFPIQLESKSISASLLVMNYIPTDEKLLTSADISIQIFQTIYQFYPSLPHHVHRSNTPSFSSYTTGEIWVPFENLLPTKCRFVEPISKRTLPRLIQS